MNRKAGLLAAATWALAAWLGCAQAPPEQAAPEEPPAATVEPTEPGRPGEHRILAPPFTAEQIRDEWIPGLRLKMRTERQGNMEWRQLEVVDADADGAQIEFTVLDADGQPVGEPIVSAVSWIELRNHAAFPADQASRQPAVRETPLGQLEGWLYTVRDPAGGRVTQLFFAHSLPGAPILLQVTENGQVVERMLQEERQRPQPRR